MVKILIAGGGAWSLICAGLVMLSNPSPSYKLVVETHAGDSYVVDFGMSKLDCTTRARDYEDNPVVYCEDETWRYSK